MKNRLLITAAALTLAMPAAASAATLFQSLPDLTVAPATNAWCSSCGGSYQVFDTFSLGSASTLNSITFAVQANYNYPTATTVSFHTLSGGLPGSTIASYTFNPSAFVSATLTGNNTALITVALPGLALGAGSYDVSFYSPTNLGVPGYAKAGGQLYQAGAGFHADQVAAFSISGLAGAVPEPATWALMILGFGAIGGVLRRKHRHAARVSLA
ncbi:PEPxxWA-CTERM sorting domain-containing protein [uncultured Sphingomonas sp.]|uniref:PEPxxWA-CTERM sorting domain-containing protein n=1 Tax=uncultured Sphingomonas sp. TaxID=158754 RepID=UPI0026129F27|nr:PEPxxWA-CTERM sorting domain-containing protein [uncultured Sphingomonas sp.]